MNHHLQRSLFFAAIFSSVLSLTACVSVNLGPQGFKKAEGVKVVEPESPFKKIPTPSVDVAWQSQKTGNTLAYSSECNNRNDIPISLMEQESLAALVHPRITQSEVLEYNDREAKEIAAEGFVDGIPIKISILLFKKNDCNYTMSFVGRKKHFDTEISHYKKFKEGFRAP